MSWIKMRTNLWTHPKVVALSSRLSVTRAHIIGALHGVWSIADQHADADGTLPMPADSLDALVDSPGFCAALAAIGWLECEAEAVKLPRYCEHNGTTAKTRAENSARQKLSRKCRANVAQVSQKCATREEKKREDKSREENNTLSAAAAAGESAEKPPKKRAKETPPDDPDFAAFWAAYPKRAGKGDAREAFAKAVKLLRGRGQAEPGAMLIQRAKAFGDAQQGADPKFIPHPASWLNKERWDDDPQTWAASRGGSSQPYRNKQNANIEQYNDFLQRHGITDDESNYEQPFSSGQGCNGALFLLESPNGSGPD